MNLDELAQQIRRISPEPVVQRLGDLLLDWKTDARTAEVSRVDVERYIGNSWIAGDADHVAVYGLWSAFRDDAIGGIGGMTMNERLSAFSLDGRFDGSRNDDEKFAIYAKLHAVP